MNQIKFTTRDLPSMGLFYDRVYNITLKTLTLGEYKDLMRCSQNYYKYNIIKVLSNVVVTDGLDVGEMVYGDVISLLMWYKCNSSIDTNLCFSTKCSKCGNKIEFRVNLGDFDMDSIDRYNSDGIILPSGRELKFAPKTFLEYEPSEDTIGHICNVFKYLTPYEIDEMDLDDFIFLKNAIDDFRIGFSYKNKVSCRFCKSVYDLNLKANHNHFFEHNDYSKILQNIFYISKYTNYKFENYEELFDYETSIQVVNDMMEQEEKNYESMKKG